MREREVALLREEQVEVELGGQALVELHAPAVERRALGGAVVGADDRRVAAGRARADVALLEHGHVANAVVSRQVVGGREAVRAAADDHDVVPRLQLGGRAPHAADAEEVPHVSPACRSRTISTTACPTSCAKKTRYSPSRAKTNACTPASLPAAGSAERSRSVSRRISCSPRTAIPARAAVRSTTKPGSETAGSPTTSARAGVSCSTCTSGPRSPTAGPRTSSLRRSERSRMPVAPSSARASGEATGAAPRERKESELTSAAAPRPGRRTTKAARAPARAAPSRGSRSARPW